MGSSSSWLSRFFSSALRAKPLTPYSSEACTSTVSKGGLLRRLGLFDLILIGIGGTIGAGIFAITGAVAHDVGPSVTISYGFAGLVSALNAFCFAELASRFPAVVGGPYLYSYTAFNELTAFLLFIQLIFDGHIGSASVARSLASYLVNMLEIFPIFKENVPSWMGGHGGKEFFGGVISINILAPILIAMVTIVLCQGVGGLSVLNLFMTLTKITIVLLVIIFGAFEVDVSNWSPFVPNGFNATVTGASAVFFSYLGYEAVTSSAEESKRPQRDLPIAILGSFLICGALYIGVCLVITGMVSYMLLGDDAPLAKAFELKGLKYMSIFVSIGAVAGLTTNLLVHLYVHPRFYLALGRDGLLPSAFAEVHKTCRTPIFSQIWVGVITGTLAGLFDVHLLSHVLSVGSLTGYSVVSACVVTLRWKDAGVSEVSTSWISTWLEGVLCLLIISCCGFGAGLCFRFGASFVLYLVTAVIAVIAAVALHYRQVYVDPPGFCCPVVPVFPVCCIFFNIFLFAQLHPEAWLRFVVLIIISVGIYAFYGQYHANPGSSNQILVYDQPSIEEALITNHDQDSYNAT
ncbi:cationic amino acid transporter 9, chloroplastic-like [Macadamia integrifolia]|uniref:cationic amino acid transporter 9, chloroplastic-like n=1 Tax=Macadamia integrifolia TaxID=60698 RepID=UPI001C4EBD60|nr:cationic amino acid transporter 9, chloroplastic-like [Macadamia integrifolia]